MTEEINWSSRVGSHVGGDGCQVTWCFGRSRIGSSRCRSGIKPFGEAACSVRKLPGDSMMATTSTKPVNNEVARRKVRRFMSKMDWILSALATCGDAGVKRTE
jgi:hypothetical protein